MSLEIHVANASNLPNLESIGEIDPYVKITIQGISKKTTVIKSQLNPTWNETLVFDLKGQPIREQDQLTILINDRERFGRNRLVGKTSLLMRDVLKSGFGQQKLSLSLFDANQRPLEGILNISILYKPPPGSEINVQPAGREIGGTEGGAAAGDEATSDDAAGSGDAGTNQFDTSGGGGGGGGQSRTAKRTGVGTGNRGPLSTKPQDFQLRVKVIEARQLPGSNISPVCRLICHTQTKQTSIQKSTNSPFWNEIFFFNFVISPAELFDKPLIFGIFNSKKLRTDAFIGSFKFDVGLVYEEPRHSFVDKWLLLCDPEDPMAGHKGYLKISTTLLGPGDDAPMFLPTKMNDAEDDVESNLLRPLGVILRPATFKLKLYHAEDIPRMDSNFIQGVKQVFGSDDRKDLVDPYFVFSFAGREVKSKVIYNCDHPEWNQELRLAIRFPSMCERIKFQIFDWDRLTQHDCVGTEFLNTAKISRVGSDADDETDGFLPAFGPCFVNFYGSPREYSELATGYEDLNLGKGDGVAYRGRVLVELQTIVGEVPLTPAEDISAEDALRVQKFLRRRRYKLHTAFMGASMISKIDSAVEFEVSIGNYGNKLDKSLPPSACTTQPMNAIFDGSHYYFLPWDKRKPCVVIDSDWEDISFRLEALNLLIGIADRLEANISNVRLAKKGNMPSPDLAQCLITLLDSLIIDCNKSLPVIVDTFHMPNQLDLQLRQFRTTELKYIAKEAKKLRETATDVDKALAEVENHLTALKKLAVEPQNSIPDIVIWMIADGKRIAYYRVPAHLLLWSENPDFRGKYCGKRDTIFLKYPGNKAERENRWEVPALLSLKIWFGLAKNESAWHKMQTEGELAVFAETYENQASSFGKWKPGKPGWSDISGKIALEKDDFKPPAGWRWDGEWDPDLNVVFERDAGHSRFMEDVYECQSRLPGTNWNAASTPWTDVKGDAATPKNEINLPEGWGWEDPDWQVDLNRAVDENGWEYAVESTYGGFGPVERNYHMCRRRRWVRTRFVKPVKGQVEPARRDVLTTDGCWEYASLFASKFHRRERKMDLFRRRRWHRKMVPEGAEEKPCFFSFAAKLEESTKEKKADELMKAVMAAPRMFLICKKPSQFRMHAYVYQGRDLLAGDSNGLSDPFARVVFMNQSQATEKKRETLCPTWDQTLIFKSVDIYSDPREIEDNPPEIIVEVFDHDAFGVAEFLGRTRVTPLVKLNPSNPKQPMLQWCEVKKGSQSGGELLLAFELFLMADGKELSFELPQNPEKNNLFMVPNGIRPEMTRTAIEVMCWGVRNMKRFQLANVTSPSVEFEVGGVTRQSKVIRNASRNPNFDEPILFFDVLMPKEELYAPPLNIRVRDNRQFGRKPLVGICVIKSLKPFCCKTLPPNADDDEISPLPNASSVRGESRGGAHVVDVCSEDKVPLQKKTMNLFGSQPKSTSKSRLDVWEEDIDWWSKFYASVGEFDKCKQYVELGYDKIQVYVSELEKVSGFKEFSDFCHTFSLVRGKNIENEESSQIGEFKGTFCVYQLPGNPAVLPLSRPKVLKNLPHSGPVECVVRVYIIRAIDLQPKDPNGLADPYILIKAGKAKVHNRDEYIPNTLNPIFGRVFEVKVTLPIEKDLVVHVKDYDLIGSDDTVGETVVDLENRYLTKCRATVGLPQSYCESGVCLWRDSQKPTDILRKFCDNNPPSVLTFVDDNTIRIGDRTYTLAEYETKKPVHSHLGPANERLALHVLNHLPLEMGKPLVSEHVETRSLYNPLQPGIEQGKLQMWVDIFPSANGPPGPPVDIKSRKPKKFELRVIIWNTKDVVLDETSITGERMSDIYVKGWIRGLDEAQETDVHYRSLDGEGNFNWRFVFPMDYIPAEQCVVTKKREHFWSLDETERKVPPVAIFQVWDNDKFSPDDFLGTVEMNLESMPHPVTSSSKCSLNQLPFDGSVVKRVSLFEQKRLKGFWPVYDEANGTRQLTGKIEMEMELVTGSEAAEKPVGRARDDPNQHPKLDPPHRPQTSFLWFTSPWKTCKFIVWRRFRWYFIGAIILILFILFIVLFFYAIPGTAVKKLFGVQ